MLKYNAFVLDNEALELLRYGYRRCHVVSYYCPHCGSCRVVVEYPPNDPAIPCALCGQQGCDYGELKVIAAFTRHPLPQPAEVWCEAIPESDFGKDDYDEFRPPRGKMRVFGVRGDARVTIKPVKVLV